ncbi:MAG TPA: hypothetical protein VFI97_05765 [Arthrobacter sp.]|nr:hypothetical protein [Arthrobacter sp.]
MRDEDEANGSNGEDPTPGVGAEGAAWPEDIRKTGDDSVDAILDRLQGLPDLPTVSQTEAYTEIHDSLRYALDADGDSD